MGPLDVVDAQAFALSGLRVGIVEHGSTQIGLVNNLGVMDSDSLEDLLASEDGMSALAVDVEGGDVQASLVAGVLRVACTNTGERDLVGEFS